MTVRASMPSPSSPGFENRKKGVVEFKCRPCILLTFLQEFKGCHSTTERGTEHEKETGFITDLHRKEVFQRSFYLSRFPPRSSTKHSKNILFTIHFHKHTRITQMEPLGIFNTKLYLRYSF